MSEISQRNNWSQRAELVALALTVFCSFTVAVSVSATTITYLAIFLLILVSGNWQERWARIRLNIAALSFWLVFALFVIGMTYTDSSTHKASHDLLKHHWLLITPLMMAIITKPTWRRYCMNAFLIAMIITLALSYAEKLGLSLAFIPPLKHRTEGSVFFEYIVQYFFMSIAAFIIGYRFFFEKNWRKVYALLFTLMTINTLFMSRGRTGYLVFLMLSAYLLYLRYKWRGIAIAFTTFICLITAAYYFAPSFNHRINQVKDEYLHYQSKGPVTSTGLRISMFKDSMILIKQHPWFGVGTGGIYTTMKNQQNKVNFHLQHPINYVENIFLNILLQFGIVGFLIVIFAIALQVKATAQLDRPYKYLMRGFMLAYFSGGLINSFFVSYCEAHLYAIFSAICFSATTATSVKQSSTQPILTERATQ